MFDLTLYPLHIRDNQEQPDLAGLAAYNAPRRVARGRAGDQLVILFSLNGNAPLSSDGLQQLLDRLAETYYQSAGSVTLALRTVAETLNQYLLERNLRNTSTGRQAIGLLNLAALHGSQLYLAHGGPTHAFLVSAAGPQHWHDAQPGTRGLGLSRTVSLRYYQAEVQTGDRLLLCSDAPATWRAELLQGAQALNPDQLRRRLLTPRPAGLNAGLLTLQTGSGLIQRVTTPAPDEFLSPAVTPSAPPVETPAPAAAPIQPAPGEAAPVQPSAAPPETPAETPAPSGEQPAPEAAAQPAPAAPLPAAEKRSPSLDILPEKPVSPPPPVQRPTRRPTPAPQPAANAAEAVQRPTPRPAREAAPSPRINTLPILQAISRTLHGERRIREQGGQAVKDFFQRILPGRSDDPTSLSSGTMIFIAIAVPLIIVIVALIVFNQRGRAQQYQEYLTLATQSALTAQGQTDPILLKTAWTNTLFYLDRADLAMPDQPDALALRQQAQTGLDQIEGVVRLPFQEAIQGGLANTVNVTRMIASSTELYLLNAAQGRVIRATLNGDQYQVDAGFDCGPGPVDAIQVGNLVDIAMPPKGNEFNASIIGIDAGGNLLFCSPGASSSAMTLTAPGTNWGQIRALTIDTDGLYVLDPLNNAVWVYNSAASYADNPALFFGPQVPPLKDATDLAINGNSLLVLHADGHLTLCTAVYSSTYDTNCSDPALIHDGRNGQSLDLDILPDTQFIQLQFTQPPDPSFYLLDSSTQALYHLSLRLSLVRQLRSLAPPQINFPDGPATAFTISPNRLAFIAFGSQVFVGQMP